MGRTNQKTGKLLENHLGIRVIRGNTVLEHRLCDLIEVLILAWLP
jgi:hypothetical protein